MYREENAKGKEKKTSRQKSMKIRRIEMNAYTAIKVKSVWVRGMSLDKFKKKWCANTKWIAGASAIQYLLVRSLLSAKNIEHISFGISSIEAGNFGRREIFAFYKSNCISSVTFVCVSIGATISVCVAAQCKITFRWMMICRKLNCLSCRQISSHFLLSPSGTKNSKFCLWGTHWVSISPTIFTANQKLDRHISKFSFFQLFDLRLHRT